MALGHSLSSPLLLSRALIYSRPMPAVAASDVLPDTIALAARSLPKVLLHEHLDGGLRPATLLDLLQRRGIAAPAQTLPELEAWFHARAHAGSLTEYLRGFALTVAAMADTDAMERVAYEAAVDAQAQGCVLAEFRIAPELFEPHGIPAAVATEALVAGLARAQSEVGLPCGLIVCAMRHHTEAEAMRSAELARDHRAKGVLAFDLAGPEAGYPLALHARALAMLREAGVPLTLHAGEADEARRVLDAVEQGAARVGHGVRLADAIGAGRDGEALVDAVRASGVHLEVCPTSNVHTGAATSVAAHPIRRLWDAGLSLSFHTDNSLISCIGMAAEAEGLMREAGFGVDDLRRMGLDAARHSFLPEVHKAAALAALHNWNPPV